MKLDPPAIAFSSPTMRGQSNNPVCYGRDQPFISHLNTPAIAFWCLTACALIAGAAQVAAWLGVEL